MQLLPQRFPHPLCISPRKGDTGLIPIPPEWEHLTDGQPASLMDGNRRLMDKKPKVVVPALCSCHESRSSTVSQLQQSQDRFSLIPATEVSTTESLGSSAERDEDNNNSSSSRGGGGAGGKRMSKKNDGAVVLRKESISQDESGTASGQQGRFPRPKAFKFYIQQNEKNNLKQTAVDLLKNATREISDWVASATAQIGICGTASLYDTDEVQFEPIAKKMLCHDPRSSRGLKAQIVNPTEQPEGLKRVHNQIVVPTDRHTRRSYGGVVNTAERIPVTQKDSSITGALPEQQQQQRTPAPHLGPRAFAHHHRETAQPTETRASSTAAVMNRDDDALWRELKGTTTSIVSTVGRWLNDSVINSEGADHNRISSTEAERWPSTLSDSCLLLKSMSLTDARRGRKDCVRSSSDHRVQSATASHLSRQCQSSDLTIGKNKTVFARDLHSLQSFPVSNRLRSVNLFEPSKQSTAEVKCTGVNAPAKFSFTSASLLKSRPMSESLHHRSTFFRSSSSSHISPSHIAYPQNGVQARQCVRHQHPIHRSLSRRLSSDISFHPHPRRPVSSTEASVLLDRQRTTAGPSHFSPSSSSLPHQQQPDPCPPRLPPPPTRDELVRSALMAKSFHSTYWTETPIKRQPLVVPPPTLWQSLWHNVDSETKKVRLLRTRMELFGEHGPWSRQTLMDAGDVCDSSPLTWREAWKSHLELTIFSIENVPYIGQVVIDTEGFRLDLPFRVQFVRIPIRHENQILTLWFNSSYPKPYGRRRSKLLFTGVISDPEDLSEESDDDEEDLRDALDDNFISTETTKAQTVEKLPFCSQHLDSMPECCYSPQNDWETYFRLDIPVSTVMQAGTLEDVAIVAPQQIFYNNNSPNLHPQTMFQILCREARNRYFEPKIKFCVKFHYQGLHSLVCTGDTFPVHPCSVDASSQPVAKVTLSSPTPTCPQPVSSPLSRSSSSRQINPALFDVRRRLYRPIKQMASSAPHERSVYIGAYDDETDLQIALELGRLNGSLQLDSAGHSIERKFRGLYSIYGEEYRVERVLIDPSRLELDLSELLSTKKESTFYLAVVVGENFYQPFYNFFMRTRTNFVFCNFSSPAQQQPQSSIESIPSSSSIKLAVDSPAAQQASLLLDPTASSHHPLPNLLLPISKLPWEAKNDPRKVTRLLLHGKAIHANLKQGRFGPQCLTQDEQQLIQQYLVPPFIQMTEEDPVRVPVTFYWEWDEENQKFCNERLDTVDEESLGGLYYLFPLSPIQSNIMLRSSRQPASDNASTTL